MKTQEEYRLGNIGWDETMASDMRDYIKLYGIYLEDWSSLWAGKTYNYHLLREWVSSATIASKVSTVWTASGCSFIFPHHIKKTYFLEGVVEGEITFAGASAATDVTNYRVSIFKRNEDTTETNLCTTGVRTLTNHAIAADDIGRYHFWIDAYEAKELSDYDRLGLRVEWNVNGIAGPTAALYHDYLDGWGYDIWVDVPLILGD